MTAGTSSSSTPIITIHEHEAHAQILPCLAAHLPHSISLLRRIQHGIAHPTPTAKVLATFPPGSSPPDDAPWLAARVDLFRGRETQMIIYSSLEKGHTSNKPIQIASARPASSSDHGHDHDHDQSSTGASENNYPVSSTSSYYRVSTFDAPQSVLDSVRDQLVSLLTYVKINLRPIYLASLSADPAPELKPPAEKTVSETVTPHNGNSNGNGSTGSASTSANVNGTSSATNQAVTLIPAPSPQAFLIGTLHTALFSLLQVSGSEVFAASKAALDGSSADPIPGLRVHRFDDPPYNKFFFRRAEFTSGTKLLPGGYRFTDRLGREGVLESQLDLVQSRTHIPRPRNQLRMMPGSAIYVDVDVDGQEVEEMPIAWAFLGLDGALATLHVEPEHRGKGLALALSKETMRRGLVEDGVFGAGGIDVGGDSELAEAVEGWVHTEVAQYNVASRRVMEKIGGEVLSTVVWTVIEICD